jgi:lipoprotein-anchoring transpeptidase ErfK/SrfK
MHIREIGLALALIAQVTAPLHAQLADSTATVRIVISLAERRLWVVNDADDTLHSAPVAVGSGRTLRSGGQSWTFTTPRGGTTVVSKEVDPAWIPPDWHYVETAREHGLKVERLDYGRAIALSDGRVLTIRGDRAGIVSEDSTFTPLVLNEEIVFGSTLYIPPLGTLNRRIGGMLGPYRLMLANGIGLHGTPYTESIGKAATHGCIRLLDDDITWLYTHVPIGSRVQIF